MLFAESQAHLEIGGSYALAVLRAGKWRDCTTRPLFVCFLSFKELNCQQDTT